ncbi:hypothetical protein DB346_08255 [Verrucomicrobia bacterium LW23]|nr:hypothetical protein DB346_08255 [Verrucomicrobia bacterium LW23]
MNIPTPFTESRAEAAVYYRDTLGWAIHPLHGPHKGDPKVRGKKPEIKGWRDWQPSNLTDELIEKYFGAFGSSNLGCVLRGPHVSVDLDSKPDKGESVRQWLAGKPELAAVPRERTGGGAHLHFLCRDLPAFYNRNGDPYDKPLVAKISDKVGAELFFDGCNLVLTPSQHANGHTYTWEVSGDIPEVTWEQLKSWFGFEEPNRDKEDEKSTGKSKGGKSKAKPWWAKFKGDLRTLDLVSLFRDQQMLGAYIDPDKGQWGVQCPWAEEHSDGGKGWNQASTDTAIFHSPGSLPGFKCLHAHCDGRDIGEVLAWFEERKPGCVDAACKQMRVWAEGQENEDGRPRVVLPGRHRPESMFAEEMGKSLAPSHEWFLKNNVAVSVGVRQFSEKVTCLAFDTVAPVCAVTDVEEHVEVGELQHDKESGDTVFCPRSMNRETAGLMLSSRRFRRQLPNIGRILDLPVPIRQSGGGIAFPKIGYDPRFQTYCDPDAPVIKPMPVAQAKELLLRIHRGFCFRDAQSITHAIARLLTPYCRGLIGWNARTPLWIFTANRPRAGKDYLAGLTSLVYEGTTCEDAPLGSESDETRKRITAALLAGRRIMHFANCQGHIDDAVLIGAITASVFSSRNIGSTEAKADLRLPNELEFSVSANMGLTFREDVEPRSRKIFLHLRMENPNARHFEIKYLHDFVLAHRGEILSAIAALVGAWIDAGCPERSSEFNSFPKWAAIVGGIMTFHGWGDPCLPHEEDGTEVGGDRLDRAMRALYQGCYERYPERWIDKQAVFQYVAQSEENDDLSFFGYSADDSKKARTRIGMYLRKFDRRELVGIRLELDRASLKSQSQQLRFTKGLEDNVDVCQQVWGGFAPNSPHSAGTLTTFESTPTSKVSDVSPSNINGNSHPGHLLHLSLGVKEKEEEKNIESNIYKEEGDIYKSLERGTRVLKVGKVPEIVRPYQVISDHSRLAEIASLLEGESTLAVDIETYGDRKGDGLNPWKGDIRLLQLCGERSSIFLLDLQALGYQLGPLASLLESKRILGHGLKFDSLWLRMKCNIKLRNVFCTLTASRVLNNGIKPGNNLDQCLQRMLGVEPGTDQALSDWGGLFLTDDQLAYAARDVAYLHQLAARFSHELEMTGLEEVFAMESQLLPVVVEMEAAGIAVDREKLAGIENRCRTSAAAVADEIRAIMEMPELNIKSQPQLLAALKEWGIDIESTNEETLQGAGDETVVPKLLEYRSLEKQAQQAATLLECVAPDGRIHGKFEPTGTATGRFSSKEPNMQNIGRGDLRTCFVAPAGRKLVVADYSQVELRAAAAIAGETKMVQAYANGDDLHRLTAAKVLNKPLVDVTKADRQLAKAVNFGLLYGQHSKGLVRYAKTSYGVTMTEEQATDIRRKFFETYGAIRQWHGESHVKANKGIDEVRTVSGRRRLIPSEASEWERFTALVNTPVQGGCADGIKAALIALATALPAGAAIISTVHDEIIVECDESIAPEVKALLQKTMRDAMSAFFPQVPIEVESNVCTTWGEK